MTKISKAQQVINHLEAGNSLSKKDCYLMFSYWNLGDIVFKLRTEHGHNYVTTIMKKTVLNEEYAVYSVPNPVVKQKNTKG